jgi:drug/metabolite transporter (DMT)-like permease
MYFRLVAEIGATPALTVEFLVTVIAVAIGAGFLGEHISAIQFVGVASILIGCALVLDLIPIKPRPATT